MAKLILSMDGLVLKEIPLAKERTSIGRKPHNDIQIDNLAVSGEHAVIVTILSDSFLEDLGSTNGTLVNGNPIKKHFLQNNDIIELGKYKLKFVGEAAAAAGAETARATAAQQVAAGATSAGTAEREARTAPTPPPMSATATTPTPIPAQAAAPAAPKSPHPLGAIQILSGANAGKELELAKPLTTLGKPGVQVSVLTRRPQGYFITHVEGANAPMVNGHAIGTAPHALKDHDVVELAGVKMEFFLKG